MQEKNGSLAGSHAVKKQSFGGEWTLNPDGATGERGGGSGSPVGSTKPLHGQPKATRIPHLNAPTKAGKKQRQ